MVPPRRGPAPLPSAARLVVVGVLTATAALGCRPRDGLPQHYDDPDAMIVQFERDDRDAWAMPDRVVRALAIDAKDAVVADIGAGSGYFTRRLAREVPAGLVYAVDIDDRFHAYIEKNREAWGTPNIEPRLAFYDDPALPEAGVDLVFMSNTYPYLKDRVAYLKKVRAVLRPGGRLAIVGFREDANVPGDDAPDPKYRIPQATVISEAEAAGFTLDREETFLPYQHFLIFRVR
ncbi:MAG: class I SAM-dependent methyltransferase [Myxococcales bacterium]|nr:class I SAM-dependent methyltransferase [Myxococcales bacterium]